MDDPSLRKKRLPQGIDRISEGQAKSNDLKDQGHGKDGVKNSAQEDHG